MIFVFAFHEHMVETINGQLILKRGKGLTKEERHHLLTATDEELMTTYEILKKPEVVDIIV
jgi:hypothetical protein